MQKLIVSFLFICVSLNAFGQFSGGNTTNNLNRSDSTKFNKEVRIKLSGNTKYTDYKSFNHKNDTVVIDTTMSLLTDLKHNYIRKDDFELQALHNQGQSFNKLGYDFRTTSVFPEFGFEAKQYNYQTLDDMLYYEVPTPTSELAHRTGMEQGQFLDAFVTMNTSKQFNFSAAYKGLRSLGKYRQSLASHGNFRGTFNYHNKRKTYQARGHIYSFDFYNEENGGLTDLSIQFFELGDPNYTDRGRLDVNYTDANNMFEGKRYFLEQKLTLFSKQNSIDKINDKHSLAIQKMDSVVKSAINLKEDLEFQIKTDTTLTAFKLDSLNAQLSGIKIDTLALASLKDSSNYIVLAPKNQYAFNVGYDYLFESKHYRFFQESAYDGYGPAFNASISDHTDYVQSIHNAYLEYETPAIGSLQVTGQYFDYNYNYNGVLYYDDYTIPAANKGTAMNLGAKWKAQYGNLKIDAVANSIISGDIEGNTFKGSVGYAKDSIFNLGGFVELTSKTPSLNKILYQSDYENYNWYNEDFKNENLSAFGFDFNYKEWGGLSASYNSIENYTYFGENSTPLQANETLNYFKAKAQINIRFGKFSLDNTVMYQNVLDGDTFFDVPELVTRNSLYFSSDLFKGNPLFLQTGVTFKYFSAYYMNAYNPVISEFVLQKDAMYGEFPMVDFFINARIQRTRLYLKLENFTSSFTGYNYYSAPTYPYRDMVLRFGLVWNFFI